MGEEEEEKKNGEGPRQGKEEEKGKKIMSEKKILF